MTTMTIALIVAIVLAITLYSVTLREVIKKGYSGKRIARLILPLGLIFIAYLSYHVFEIQPADWAQIMLMLGLVSVTGIYAYASVRMAEEMRETRYDTVRPVIDFKLMESYPVTIQGGLTIKEQEEADLAIFPGCKLHNIGIGPATDVYSFTLTVGGERRQLYLGSLVKGATTKEAILSTEQRGDCWFLVAYYRDAYGRSFESSREVHLDVETGEPLLGKLNIIVVKEDKKK